MIKSRKLWTLGAATLFIATAALVTAQSTRSGSDSSTQDALLSEVRGFRADISGFASSSFRAQLLMGRLQLQEQRILTMGRKLTDVQSSLATSLKEVAEQGLRSQAWENSLKTSGAAERQRLEEVNPNPTTQLHEIQVRARELEAQQIELINQINAEQDRWTDFNGRLDALERLLPTRGPQ